jgi:hypothetical protein
MTNNFFGVFFLILLSQASWGSIDKCIKDAKDYGEVLRQYNREECGTVVVKHPNKVFAMSRSKMIRAHAVDNIIVLERMDLKTNAVTKTDVLAGDQTGLSGVEKIWIDEENNVMLVLQKGSPKALLTFTLAYASNTAPLRHFHSPILNTVSQVRYLAKEKLLALISKSQKAIRFINSDADNVRYHLGNFKPGLYGEVSGPSSNLQSPIDVITSSDSSKLYVLDQGKVLSFAFKKDKMSTFEKVKKTELAKSFSYLEITPDGLYVVGPAGREKIKL